MHALGALGAIIDCVEGNIDPIVPWQKRVGFIESKWGRGSQKSDIEE